MRPTRAALICATLLAFVSAFACGPDAAPTNGGSAPPEPS